MVLIILKTKLQVRAQLRGLQLSLRVAKFKLIFNIHKEIPEDWSLFQHELKTGVWEME